MHSTRHSLIRIVLDDLGDRNAPIFSNRHQACGGMPSKCRLRWQPGYKTSPIDFTPNDRLHRRPPVAFAKPTRGTKSSSCLKKGCFCAPAPQGGGERCSCYIGFPSGTLTHRRGGEREQINV